MVLTAGANIHDKDAVSPLLVIIIILLNRMVIQLSYMLHVVNSESKAIDFFD